MRSFDSSATGPTLFSLLAAPGDEAAWRRFVGRYYDFVLEGCRRAGLGDNDAEEACAVVFEGLVSALPGFRYDPARRFRGYLQRAVLNAVAKHYRGQKRRPLLVDPMDLDRWPNARKMSELTGELDERILADLEMVYRAFEMIRRSIALNTWEAYWLTAVEGRRGDEVAQSLGMQVAAVYVAKSRVAARVRAAIAELGG